jgi:8-oxo-dGTP pyrophosphatase MutT (NUDIX family)
MQEPASRVVWECPYWRAEERRFTGADGQERIWYSAHRPDPNTVHILALTPDGLVPLLRQWRHPLEAWVWELPAGLCDVPSENLEETAIRELAEETGWHAAEMLHLFSGTVSPGLTDELYHAFLGLNLEQTGEGGGTGGEQIEVRYVPFTQLLMFVLEAARVGDLVDSKIITHITLALGKLDEMARHANTEDKSKV